MAEPDLALSLPPIAVKVEDHDMYDVPGDFEEIKEEHDELTSASDSSGEDGPQTQTKKRTRLGKKSTRPRKRYVRGKQGGLKGLMNMPIDIFTQVALLLYPADLITLMWRHAESNIPGLPACPPDMCEPQYAALLFSKYCTLCGANATAKPDSILQVRLCATCRDTKLLDITGWEQRRSIDETLVHHSAAIKTKSDKSRSRSSTISSYSLMEDVEEMLRKRQELLIAGDNQGLAIWDKVQRKAVSDRRKYALEITRYLESAGKSRGEELEGVKQHRREAITDRLKTLGWANEDMVFDDHHAKPWRALVDVPKPLTDRIWSNILPKLTPLLEENRKRRIQYEKLVRRIERRKRVNKFLLCMRDSENPLEPILKVLGVQPPLPSTNSSNLIDIIHSQSSLYNENPFPNTRLALGWDCLVDISEKEMTVEEVDMELSVRKDKIRQKVIEWRADIERQLVERYVDGLQDSTQDVIVKTQGNTDLTAHLSGDLRLLLRADTVFKDNSPTDYNYSFEENDPSPCYYPSMASSIREWFFEEAYYPEASDTDNDIDLSCYQRYAEIEIIIRALLQSLGMPDVARIELQIMKPRFLCGRCTERSPKTWDQMVQHYTHAAKTWNERKDNTTILPTRYPIVYRNVHELDSQDNPKPLTEIITEEEAQHLLDTASSTNVSLPICLMCAHTNRGQHQLSPDKLAVHMQDFHSVLQPVEHVHYGQKEFMDYWGDEWMKKWEAFHDTQASGS